MRFIDTNIFVRHLTASDASKAQACFALLQALEQNKVQAWTSDLVVAEVVFVLSAKRPNSYGYARTDIRDKLLPILNLPALHLPSKVLYDRVFALYTALPIDFIDAYHVALMEASGQLELYSYDTDSDRVKSIIRIEP